MARPRKKKETAELPSETLSQEPIAPSSAPVAPAAESQPAVSATAEDQAAAYSDASRPYSIAHNHAAGVRLLKYGRFKQMQIQFAGDVSPELDRQMRERGWQHRPSEGVYTKQFGDQGEAAAVIDARRYYGELCQQLSPDRGRA